MNKSDARKYASRLIAGYIEDLYNCKKPDPLVYDEYFDEEAQGKRLSARDKFRVYLEVDKLLQDLINKGYERKYFEYQGHFESPNIDGIPGARWKGYKAWMKKQGRS